jgi:hypothetical protein
MLFHLVQDAKRCPLLPQQWRANLSPSGSKVQEWARDTFLYWMEFEKRHSVQESGIQV